MKMDKVAGSGNDEYYTPLYAITPITKYIPPKSIVTDRLNKAQGQTILNEKCKANISFIKEMRKSINKSFLNYFVGLIMGTFASLLYMALPYLYYILITLPFVIGTYYLINTEVKKYKGGIR